MGHPRTADLHEEIRRKTPRDSGREPTNIEQKLLQLQMMLPEIIQGWQAKLTIATSIGIQATPSNSLAITSTADDKLII